MKIKTMKKTPVAKTVVKKSAKCAAKTACTKTVGKATTFTFHAEKGKAVYLAGQFNNWDPTAKKMSFKDGIYSTQIKLRPGTYEYKFVIDGTWCADPENANFVPNDQGTFNSVITIK